MTVAFSPAAERDLEEIGDHIAQDSPIRAIAFVAEIRERCLAVEAAPEAAPLRVDLAAGLRMAVQGRCLIFYRILPDQIRVERVLHGARDIAALFRREDD